VPEKRVMSPLPGMPESEAEKVEVVSSKEQWSVYSLNDGTTIQIKPTLTEVWRFSGLFDPEGNPIYQTKAILVQTVSSPPDLRKKG